MDERRFDGWTRHIGGGMTRRGLALMLGLVGSGWAAGPLIATDVAAARKKRKKKRRRNKPEPSRCFGVLCDGDCYPDCCPGDERDCYTGPDGTRDIGLCVGGLEKCLDTGRWSTCRGEVTPTAEACNGFDDDCDGEIDNEATCPTPQVCQNKVCCLPPGASCVTGVPCCEGECFGIVGNQRCQL